ncbi:MAG: protein TolQ, partial [Gammaproteobacteria bacterium]
MTADMSFLTLVLEASFVVQLVMLALLLASIASWAVIFKKRGMLKDARGRADRFETEFWSGGDLTA